MPRMTGIKRERARELRQTMTPSERMLWEQVRNHRLGGLHFRRQHVMRGFIADFYCDAAKLIIELDGPIHQQQLDADEERDAILTAGGYRVLRITNQEIRDNLPDVLARIRAACGTPTPNPSPAAAGEGSQMARGGRAGEGSQMARGGRAGEGSRRCLAPHYTAQMEEHACPGQ